MEWICRILSCFLRFPHRDVTWVSQNFDSGGDSMGFSNFRKNNLNECHTCPHRDGKRKKNDSNLISTSLTSQSFPVRVIEIYLYTFLSLRLDLMSSHTIFAHLRCVPLQVFINGSYLHIRFLTPLDLSHSFSFSHDYISLCIRYPPPLYIFATGFAIIYAAALPWRLLSFPIDALSVYSPLVQHLSHSCS